MKQFTQRYAAVLFAIVLTGSLTGCGDPEPLKSLGELNQAFNDLADAMETVHDAESAQAAVPDVESACTRAVRLTKRMMDLWPKYKDTKIRGRTMYKFLWEQQRIRKRVNGEVERLDRIRGLPVEFWNVTRKGSVDVMVAGIPLMQATQTLVSKEAADYAYNMQALLNKHGCGKVVNLDLTNLPSRLAQQAYDRIGGTTPGATLYHIFAEKEHNITLGPVDDFQAFVNALDLGTITYQDEGRRLVVVEVDRRKLGARANSDEEERQLREEESRQRREEERKERDADRARAKAERARLEKERREPDPNDSDYYEQLVKRMKSKHYFDRNKTIEVLLNTQPEQVKSAETRKQIAQAFKYLVLEGDSNQVQAMRGLVIWGGKSSVPVFLDLLADPSTRLDKATIFKALAELPDERAAAPVAAYLGDLFNHDAAYTCLHRLGPLAEDALIDLAPSNNPSISLSAVQLLGAVGTEKCLELLNQATRSRNPHVKTTARRSIRKILNRQKKEKEAEQKQE